MNKLQYTPQELIKKKGKFRTFLMISALILGYSIFLELCMHLIAYNTFLLYDDWKQELFNHIGNILPLLLMTAICIIVIFFITDTGIFSRRFGLKLIMDILLTSVMTFASFALLLYIYYQFVAYVEVEYGSLIAVWLITMLMLEMAYYMSQAKRTMAIAEQAKLEAIQYQYDAFRAQVNPHFLFNSLNMLIDIIETDKDNAVKYTEALSDIYRYVLTSHKKMRVTLSEELSFLESYIHIITLKYNHFLKVVIKNDIDTTKFIIPYTLQLLVENITKHNIISENNPMEVYININDEAIIIKNSIKRKKCDTSTGLGLNYLFSLYKSCGRSISIKDDGQTFTAIIPYL